MPNATPALTATATATAASTPPATAASTVVAAASDPDLDALLWGGGALMVSCCWLQVTTIASQPKMW